MLKHHSLTNDDFKNSVGIGVEPDTIMTAKDVEGMKSLYDDSTYAKLVRLLQIADGLSASVDRASEIVRIKVRLTCVGIDLFQFFIIYTKES